eukprot:GHRR01012171.1.p1 GENE.GHRR01012171.1~~GHRR01012171.1.p1  ORF type:complete len:130 (-),score=13.26 GHRR01012171.1:652-1041(-)
MEKHHNSHFLCRHHGMVEKPDNRAMTGSGRRSGSVLVENPMDTLATMSAGCDFDNATGSNGQPADMVTPWRQVCLRSCCQNRSRTWYTRACSNVGSDIVIADVGTREDCILAQCQHAVVLDKAQCLPEP